ncbi:hypothetical protein LTR53_009266, partial [Teratosphaeriaceae sp. CCFEE 6253]
WLRKDAHADVHHHRAMSDEASAAAVAAADPSTDGHDERRQAVPPTAADEAKKRRKNRQMFNKKRGELLDDLLRCLDILVYAELSAIYYMEYEPDTPCYRAIVLICPSCSFFRLVMRAAVQFVFLTPKPSLFPEPPSNRPYVGAILGSNLLCLALHMYLAAPSAGEATRGYLHGGLAMDFVGQKGPSSKLHLIILDLLVVVLQIVHLSAHITRQRLKEGSVSVTTPTGRHYTPPASSTQDADAEERGVRRSEEQQGGIEMQSLDPTGTVAASETAEDTDQDTTLLDSTTARTDAHMFDAFNSGQIILADLDIFQTVKEQFWSYQTAPREPQQSGTDLRRNVIGQLLRWRTGASVGRPA